MKSIWLKFWGLPLSLLQGTMLGGFYTDRAEELVGAGFSEAVIISRRGFSVSYLSVSERERFAEIQIKRYTVPDVKRFCEHYKKILAHLKNTYGKLFSDKIPKERMLAFLEEYDAFAGPYMTPRAIIDYINPDKVPLVIDELKEIRLLGETIHAEMDTVLMRFLQQEFPDTPKEALSCMTRNELQRYLTKGKPASVKVLQERYDCCAVIHRKGSEEIITDQQTIDALENSLIPSSEKDVRGMVAQKGTARGIVRVVFHPEECKNFNKGDILVTPMTRPEFVPLMEKAGAIVTDGGGLLCHAAIVARELGKPCIIGTQTATKTLKTGDDVEVDAIRGIVRKL